MLLQKQDKTPVRPHTFTLRDDLASKLTAYSRYAESAPDYVVAEALGYVFKQDKDFQLYWSEHAAEFTNPASVKRTRGKSKAAAGGE
jgi:hypothetical protein